MVVFMTNNPCNSRVEFSVKKTKKTKTRARIIKYFAK